MFTGLGAGWMSEMTDQQLRELHRSLLRLLRKPDYTPRVVNSMVDKKQPERTDKQQPFRGSFGWPGLSIRRYNGRLHVVMGPADEFPIKPNDRTEKPSVV